MQRLRNWNALTIAEALPERECMIDDKFEGPIERRGPLRDYHFDPLRSFDEGIESIAALAPISKRARSNLLRALQSIDPDCRRAFLECHCGKLTNFDADGPVKYADIPYWAYRNVLLAQWLELDESDPIDILDIGMGPGNFAMVANSMGHRTIGTDVTDPWYGELCALAGVERIIAPVQRRVPYRPVDRRFDLITIMLPVFHRQMIPGGRTYWSTEDWRYLLHSLVENMLKEGGRIFILMPLDKRNDGSLAYSPVLPWAESLGARLGRTFEGEPIRHILFDPASPELFA